MSRRLVDGNEIVSMKECSFELQDKINAMPAVFTDDSLDGGVVKHEELGHWIEVKCESIYRYRYYRCSLCKNVVYTKTTYCPHCGAVMNEVTE